MDTPDEICEINFEKGVKILVKDMGDFILIEGTQQDLEFLSQLIVAQAQFVNDCGFQFSPTGGGRSLFRKGSDKGIYIHRIAGSTSEGEKRS